MTYKKILLLFVVVVILPILLLIINGNIANNNHTWSYQNLNEVTQILLFVIILGSLFVSILNFHKKINSVWLYACNIIIFLIALLFFVISYSTSNFGF